MAANGTIQTTKRRNSLNGNPSYSVVFVRDDGVIFTGTTKPNAMFCYCMPPNGRARVTCHLTNSNRVVFDNITKEI